MSNFFKNLKNVKKNYETVKSNPLASLKFRYYMAQIFVGVLIAYLAYRMISMIISYNVSTGYMNIIGKVIMMIVLIMIISKAWGVLTPMKKAIKQYELLPADKRNVFIKSDVKAEIDDILNKFDKKETKK